MTYLQELGLQIWCKCCRHLVHFFKTKISSKRYIACREPAAGDALAVNGLPEAVAPQANMTDGAAEAPMAVDQGASGWAEHGMLVGEQGRAAQQDDMVAAKFKPGIKFKLGP